MCLKISAVQRISASTVGTEGGAGWGWGWGWGVQTWVGKPWSKGHRPHGLLSDIHTGLQKVCTHLAYVRDTPRSQQAGDPKKRQMQREAAGSCPSVRTEAHTVN